MKKDKRGRKLIPNQEVIKSLQVFFKKVKRRFTMMEYDLWSKKRCCSRVITAKFNKGWRVCLKKAGVK